MKALLSAKNLSKNYNKKKILENVDLSLFPGNFYTLLGANGAGKSTLMRVLSGVELPDKGGVNFGDYPVNGWDIPNKSDLFYINENIQIETGLKLHKFASYISELFPRWDEPFFKMMIKTRQFDLNKFYSNCSRGQKMQYNMILALAANPRVLLLDEITSVMDVYTRRYFLQLLHEFTKKGGAVLMTTNIITELEFYTDHLFFLKESQLVLNSKLDDLREDFIKVALSPRESSLISSYPDVLWVGMNKAGESFFLLPLKRAKALGEDHFKNSRIDITLEDIFIYYSHFDQVDINHENAA